MVTEAITQPNIFCVTTQEIKSHGLETKWVNNKKNNHFPVELTCWLYKKGQTAQKSWQANNLMQTSSSSSWAFLIYYFKHTILDHSNHQIILLTHFRSVTSRSNSNRSKKRIPRSRRPKLSQTPEHVLVLKAFVWVFCPDEIRSKTPPGYNNKHRSCFAFPTGVT